MRILVTALLTICMVGVAQADLVVPFTQTLTWSNNLITRVSPFSYEHNVLYATPPLEVPRVYEVLEAELALSFLDDDPADIIETLATGKIITDQTESIRYGLDASGWAKIDAGQDVDTALYTVVVDARFLNDNGILGVKIGVYNGNGTGDVYLTSSTLSGIATTPVPAAVLLGMLGLGVAGLKLRRYA